MLCPLPEPSTAHSFFVSVIVAFTNILLVNVFIRVQVKQWNHPHDWEEIRALLKLIVITSRGGSKNFEDFVGFIEI